MGDDLILGWDWSSSRDLHQCSTISTTPAASACGPDPPRCGWTSSLPESARSPAHSLSLVTVRRLLLQVERETPAATDPPPPPTPPPLLSAVPRGSTGWSRPLHADCAELSAVEAAALQAARARRRPPGPTAGTGLRGVGRCADGVEVNSALFYPFSW